MEAKQSAASWSLSILVLAAAIWERAKSRRRWTVASWTHAISWGLNLKKMLQNFFFNYFFLLCFTSRLELCKLLCYLYAGTVTLQRLANETGEQACTDKAHMCQAASHAVRTHCIVWKCYGSLIALAHCVTACSVNTWKLALYGPALAAPSTVFKHAIHCGFKRNNNSLVYWHKQWPLSNVSKLRDDKSFQLRSIRILWVRAATPASSWVPLWRRGVFNHTYADFLTPQAWVILPD